MYWTLELASYLSDAPWPATKDELIDYLAKIVLATRNNGDLYLGASPRASLAILKAAKAMAVVRGRDFVTPDDIKDVAYPVLNHRIILSHEREMEGIDTEERCI